MTTNYKTITCVAGSKHTILGLLKRYNGYNLDQTSIDLLLQEFSKLNPEAHPPKIGQKLLIPILIPNDKY